MPDTDQEQEAFVRGFHGIPNQHELAAMSFAEMASVLSSTKEGSPKYMVVERAMKLVIAQDQAKINRSNVILGALMGGAFGLCGVVLGAYLKDSPPFQQPAPSSTVQQIQQSNLGIKPQVANAPTIQPIASQPIPVPNAIKQDAQAGQNRP